MARFCTNCGTKLDEDSRFCTNCGAVIDGEDDATAPLAGAAPGAAPGATPGGTPGVAKTAVMAPVAGAAPTPGIPNPAAGAPQPGQPGQPPEGKSGSKKPLIIGIVIAVVVIVAAALVAYFVFFQDSPTSSRGSSSASASSAAAEKMITVTYETGGGTVIDPQEFAEGAKITTPSEPQRDGYTFDGWYYDADFKEKATFPITAKEDIVLYAQWSSQSASSSSASAGSSDPFTQSNVEISVTGENGDTRTATIHRQGTSGRVFPDSNTRLLSDSEIRALSDAERCVAWNEIIAASSGYEFKNSGLRNYFTTYCGWYKPNPSATGAGSLSSEANKNIEALKAATDSWWQHLATS